MGISALPNSYRRDPSPALKGTGCTFKTGSENGKVIVVADLAVKRQNRSTLPRPAPASGLQSSGTKWQKALHQVAVALSSCRRNGSNLHQIEGLILRDPEYGIELIRPALGHAIDDASEYVTKGQF